MGASRSGALPSTGGEWIVIHFPYLTGDPEKDEELHRPMITSHSRPDMPVDGGADAIARWWEAELLGYQIAVVPERDGFDAWAHPVGAGPCADIWLAHAATDVEAADDGLEAIRRHDGGGLVADAGLTLRAT